MKLRKIENNEAGGGYFIYVKVGEKEFESWWQAPPKDEQIFDYSYLRDRYPVITTPKRAKEFSKLWIEMWDKEDKPKARKTIEDFIKENHYSYKVENILDSYQKYWMKKAYTSYTMTHCIKNLEPQIKTLLDMWEG
jgi:hypothetical protein